MGIKQSNLKEVFGIAFDDDLHKVMDVVSHVNWQSNVLSDDDRCALMRIRKMISMELNRRMREE